MAKGFRSELSAMARLEGCHSGPREMGVKATAALWTREASGWELSGGHGGECGRTW